jgi:hypothetical protein
MKSLLSALKLTRINWLLFIPFAVFLILATGVAIGGWVLIKPLLVYLMSLTVADYSKPEFLDNLKTKNIEAIANYFVLSFLFFCLAGNFMTAGLLGLAKEIVYKGSASLQQFWIYGKRFFFRLLGLHLVLFLGSLVISIISSRIVYLEMILSLVFTIGAMYASYIVVDEDASIIKSIEKSFRICLNGLFTAFGGFVVLICFVMIILIASYVLLSTVLFLLVVFLLSLYLIPATTIWMMDIYKSLK